MFHLKCNTTVHVVLVQHRRTRPFIPERLLMGRKESNQTNKLRSFVYRMFINVKMSTAVGIYALMNMIIFTLS